MTRKNSFYLMALVMSLFLSGCTNNHSFYQTNKKSTKPGTYSVHGKKYRVLSTSANYQARGGASWYGRSFNRKRTSSGERYNMYGLTAAHRTLPLGSYVRVTNLANGKQVVVRVNDRGPFVASRLIDLSYAAAKRIGMNGTGRVEVKAVARA